MTNTTPTPAALRVEMEVAERLRELLNEYEDMVHTCAKTEVCSDVWDKSNERASAARRGILELFVECTAPAEWQPIETAPRDQTPVLLYGEIAGEVGGIYCGGPRVCIGMYCRSTDYKGFNWTLEHTDAYCVWCKPTHWQPLPEVPE